MQINSFKRLSKSELIAVRKILIDFYTDRFLKMLFYLLYIRFVSKN
jgi:hypothetical protein